MTQKAYQQAAAELAKKADMARQKREQSKKIVYTRKEEPARPPYIPSPGEPGFRHF